MTFFLSWVSAISHGVTNRSQLESVSQMCTRDLTEISNFLLVGVSKLTANSHDKLIEARNGSNAKPVGRSRAVEDVLSV